MSKEKYLKHIEKVFKSISNHQLYTKLSKCFMDVKGLEFCRHVIRNNNSKPVASKIKIINK